MRVGIPHELPREEVRRRLRDNIHRLTDHVPAGATVEHDWPGEDRMNLRIAVLGATVTGFIEIEDRQVVVDLALPPALAFFEPLVAGAVRDQAPKLLTKD
jgi:hypothetical protein